MLVGVRSVAAASVALLVLSGCGDGGKTADPDPTTSPPVEQRLPHRARPTPTVAPASGPVLDHRRGVA